MERLGPPLDTRAAHRLLRATLRTTLEAVEPGAWARATGCPGWSVKDVAAHLVGNALARLSAGRDGFAEVLITGQPSHEAFVAALDARNEAWVAAWRPLSPQVVLEHLTRSGAQVLDHLETLPADAEGWVVSWAGDGPHAAWLDAAREYSEDWAHTHDVRDALGVAALDDPALLAPLLDTVVRALPHAYRDVAAPAGTVLALEAVGTVTSRWLLVRDEAGWALARPAGTTPEATAPTATVVLGAEDAWRLLLRRGDATAIRARARVEGDAGLAAPLWRAAAFITTPG